MNRQLFTLLPVNLMLVCVCFLHALLIGPVGADDGELETLLTDLERCLQLEIKTAKSVEELADETLDNALEGKLGSLLLTLRFIKAIRQNPEALFDSTSRMQLEESYAGAASSDCDILFNEVIMYAKVAGDARLKAIESAIQTFETELGAALLQAKVAADLDPWFVKVRDFEKQSIPDRMQSHGASNNYQEMLAAWQNYLAYAAAEDTSQATQALSSLNRMVAQLPIVPRSALIERELALRGLKMNHEVDPGYTVDSVIAEFRRTGDTGKAIERLTALTSFQQPGSDVHQVLNFILMIQEVEALMDENSPTMALVRVQRSVAAGRHPAALEGDVRRIQRRALLMLMPEDIRQSDTGQPLDILVEATARALQDRGEWKRLWEFLKALAPARHGLDPELMPMVSNEITVLEAFLHAQAFEEAGILTRALGGYENVLNSTSRFGPQEVAKKAVARLRGPMAEALREDQQRVADEPSAAPKRYSITEPAFDRQTPSQITAILEDLINKRLGPENVDESEKEASEDTPPIKEKTSEK